jgi:D-3-phosphoglycerate dehydrogenase
VLITDYVHPLLITGLEKQGYFVHYAPEIERPQVLDWIPGCTGIVVNTKVVVDAALLEGSVDLKWVARLGSGLDTIDLDACKVTGISVISTPQANANAVAEHAFGMLLALMRNIVTADREVRLGQWYREKNRGQELKGRTIGIIGFGNNGSAFASKFAGWNVRVLAHDKYKTGFASQLTFVTESTLEEVLDGSDVLSLHVPLTEETNYLVDADFLTRCRSGVILINSSRGRVVRMTALLNALRSGHIGGACLDVFENEKPGTYTAEEQEMYAELATFDNVVHTPHIAGWTFESKRRIAEQIVQEVAWLGSDGEM